MRVLVLGGQGFIGKTVMKLLENSKHQVFSLSRRNELDLTDYAITKERLNSKQPEIIINCAAHVGSLHYVTQYSADVVNDNMQMILNLYRAVKEVCPHAKVINPISNCSYPGNANIHTESGWWNGPVHKSVWPFANSKRMWVVVSQCYGIQYDIKTTNFLVANSYGPGDYTDPNKTHALNGMIIRMLRAESEKQAEFTIWGSGKPMREWIYVKDMAQMLVNAIDMEEGLIDPVNVAQNKAYAIRETAEMIKDLTGYKGVLKFDTKYQDGAPTKQLDDKLFRSKFPDFTFTNIKEGIRETIAYYQKILD